MSRRLQAGLVLVIGSEPVMVEVDDDDVSQRSRRIYLLPHGAPGQITILKTAAGQCDTLIPDVFRNVNNRFGQRVMEFCGNFADAGCH